MERAATVAPTMRWHIVRDARLPLKYSELFDVATACPVCYKQYPR